MAILGVTFRLPRGARTKSCSPSSKVRRWIFIPLLFVWLLLPLDPGRAQEESKEYQLKAAFLFNFAQFVKWPSGAFAGADVPFDIGILGDDPFGSALEETIQGETIENHKLRVIRGRTLDDLKDCQLIFICKSEEGHLPQILSQLDSKPVLTVSEVDDFAKNGGDIDFYLAGGKVRFEINPQSAQRCGLKISSQLLNLGKIVAGGN